MKLTKDNSILIEVADVETALSEHFGREVKIGEVDCRVFVHEFPDGYQGVDWVEFSVDGSKGVADMELWNGGGVKNGDEFCYLEDSLRNVEVDIDEIEEQEDDVCGRIFDFDAKETFRSVDFGIS